MRYFGMMAVVIGSVFSAIGQSTVPDRTWLFAPWRYAWDNKYRQSPSKIAEGCVFCAKLARDQQTIPHDDPDKYFMVVRFDQGTCITINQMPYSEGHILLIPAAHLENFTDLKGAALYEWAIVRNWAGPILQKLYTMDGFNAGINFGRIGGQSVKHIHEHIIPRKLDGFIGAVTNTRMLGETPQQTYEHIVAAFTRLRDMLREGREHELCIEKLVVD